MLWPLDPGFGCAAAQRVPASRAGTRSQDVRQSSRSSVRSRPLHTDAPRPAPGYRCRHARVDGPERTSGRNASPSGITPSNISSPAHQPGPRTEVSLGARAHTTRSTQHAHAPPQLHARHRRHLTPHHQTSKRQRVPLDLRDWSRVISALVRQKLAVELPQQRRAHLGGVVVWEAGEAWIGGYREVPYSDEARELIAPWMSLRSVIAPGHDRALLNLHAGPTVRQPMTEFTFSRLLGTYIGPGWTFRRLRDTCALRWVQERVPVLELVDRLGLAVSSIDRFLALAPITTKELAESALMRLMGRRT